MQLEFVGTLGLYWQEKVLDDMGVSIWEEIANFWDTQIIVNRPYAAYQQALQNGYSQWDASNPDESLVNYMNTIDTQDSTDRITAFLNSIYKLVGTGDIPSGVLDGSQSSNLTTESGQVVTGVVNSAVDTTSSGLKSLLNSINPTLLIVAVIGVAGFVGYEIIKHEELKK